MKIMHVGRIRVLFASALGAWTLCMFGADFRVPGSEYPAQVRSQISILPGGRVLRPFGRQVATGTAPFALALSPSGKTVVTANIGSRSLTVMVPGKNDSPWSVAEVTLDNVGPGLAMASDNTAWLSEGTSGRVDQLTLSSENRHFSVSLNSNEFKNSFTGPLVSSFARNLICVLDTANSRAVLIDARKGVVLSSIKTGSHPSALALSPQGDRLYVAATGDADHSASISMFEMSDPAAPNLIGEVPLDGEAPSGIAIHQGQAFVSLAHADAISVIDTGTGKRSGQILLRIPGLESYRGITPLGMTVDETSGKLLVAEGGINAVGVIDPAAKKLLGHVPAGWFPDAIAVSGSKVYVANARGFGTGPSSPLRVGDVRRGTVTSFTLPSDSELAHQTEIVMQANGFQPLPTPPKPSRPLPPIRYVVLIAKGNRSFDEIFGDLAKVGDRMVLAEPFFARFGSDGYVSGDKQRFSLHVNVTPNQHEMAARWTLADNFYAGSDFSCAGESRLLGALPDLEGETRAYSQGCGKDDPIPPATPLWHHLAEHEIENLEFPPPSASDLNGSNDLNRADRFIALIRKQYLDTSHPLPRFIFLRLPDDCTAAPNSEAGFPYRASYVAENDYALGRVVEFLSSTPWWKEMAIFVTETGGEGGADHVDLHRVPLLGIGPWFRHDYVSRTNGSAPSLLATVLKLLGVPPMSLYDATAADMTDMLGVVPDFSPYRVQPEDPRLFDPKRVH